MIIYRISDCRFINDLSGKGAAMFGGRWNSKDTYMLYTAESRALALLEAVAHIGRIPESGFCIATIEIPGESIEILSAEKLPQTWASNPPPDTLKVTGDNFISAGKYLALKVPSVLISEEHNYLLNPNHPDFKKVRITHMRAVSADERLFPQ